MDISRILNKKRRLRKLAQDVAAVLEQFPGLSPIHEYDVPVALVGNLKISDNEGVEQGNWDIRVTIPKSYPFGFPVLFETSEKIKRTADAHIDIYGEACVELDIIVDYRAKKGISLITFMNEYVIKFFCWNLLRDADTEGLLEWDHREDGHKQFFYETLETNNDPFILMCIDLIAGKKLPERNEPCFCEGGRKYKKCHEKGVKHIQRYEFSVSEYRKLFM